jgi:heme-degrading monooxygenase HmoA
MSHVRLWRFVVPEENEARFVAAYGPDGDWARLFAEAQGFVRVELWRGEDGSFMTADHWASRADFDRFQANLGERYHALDAELEELATEEIFIGAFDTA